MALTPAEKQAAYRERQRQKALGELPATPGACNIPATERWNAAIKQARSLLEQTREEMQAYLDDRSDEWQEGDRGVAHAEHIEEIETALDNLPEHVKYAPPKPI
jgi:hypothetical protein